jgi:hypothetical protein
VALDANLAGSALHLEGASFCSAGCSEVLGASTIVACSGLAVDALHAYAVGSDGLSRWPVGGGAGEIVAPLFGADVVLGATRVFVSSAPYILEIPK